MAEIVSQRNIQVETLMENWNLPFELVDFPLSEVQVIEDQQVRFSENIADKARVSEYLVQYQNGAVFPPLVLRKPGILIDGNTRHQMAKKAGLTHFPAYLVDVRSGDLARAFGAQLNQMGGQRLTPGEAQHAALEMLRNLTFSDAQIGAAVGRTGQQVRGWRLEIEAAKHADKVNVAQELAKVPGSQHKLLAKVILDKPFAEVVKLASDRRIPHAELLRIVKEVEGSSSEDEAMAVVDRARTDLRPTGPGGLAVAVNLKAKRMRMVLPQVLNLAPPMDIYDPVRAAEDRDQWQQVRALCERMLAMYETMQVQVSFDDVAGSASA